jgi:hypothetical protein
MEEIGFSEKERFLIEASDSLVGTPYGFFGLDSISDYFLRCWIFCISWLRASAVAWLDDLWL